MTPKILAVASGKGGVAKTTTAYWLGRLFSDRGYHPMLIDIDPVATLTRLLGINLDEGKTIADVLLGDTPLVNAVHGGYHEVRIIGANGRLAWAAAYMQAQSPNHKFLLSALRQLPGNVIAIVDCPPWAGSLVVNSLVAATHVVIPVEPEDEAIDGMLQMISMANDVQDLGNGTQIVGAIITRANVNVTRHETGIERIHRELSERNIPVLGIIPMRQGQDAPSKLEQAYDLVAVEILRQIGATYD